ncbi:methylmalonyl-CoA mutase subunit beta [Croceitalea rosinachiae]|uniref:Methylmalonyl-CoA mutase subunit beta n=1 Tax=Croceitalea rosinachiae TaxID=3075596 RepID=A0ABU3AB18_9FLAO|nr:methylmalonyl-CoA mutase subunit beta [Croceitalea sp. F388]MDT0607010.1 methylmalonyl-CoA mutase subunit beta [Croceitalea sp. F388]
MKSEALFSEFPEVSAKQWKQKIQFDLKGADYNKSLIWESLEGIHVKPFYHSEDLKEIDTYPLPRDHTWTVGQVIYAQDDTLANKKALDVLSRGASSLVFTMTNPLIDWGKLFEKIDLNTVSIHLNFEFLDLDFKSKLFEFIGGKDGKIFLNIDILGNLAKTGNWYHSLEKDHEILESILAKSNKSNTAILGVDLGLYQNAGANMVQQLAYTLAHANEYLNHFKNLKKLSLTIKVAVGGNYFFEIAKIKALRWLIQSLSEAYNVTIDCHIITIPSKRNKTIYDYNVNMLRTTSECMSAVLGGGDTVCNLPYDALYHKDNEFGERIARNQLLLLKEESYFDEAVHAVEGSYYIESLAQQLAEKALALFKQIEAAGGFLKQLKGGIIQKKIKESAAKEQTKFDSGELVLLGTNKYQNPDDKIKGDLELYPFVKREKRKTVIEPIIEKRLSEATEQNRLKDE